MSSEKKPTVQDSSSKRKEESSDSSKIEALSAKLDRLTDLLERLLSQNQPPNFQQNQPQNQPLNLPQNLQNQPPNLPQNQPPNLPQNQQPILPLPDQQLPIQPYHQQAQIRDQILMPRRGRRIDQGNQMHDEQPFRADQYLDSDESQSEEFDRDARRRLQRRQHHRNRERFQRDDIKLEIPEYDGKSQGDDFVDWLLTIERLFDLRDYSEEKKVKLVAIKLRGYASLWWENLKKERERQGQSRIQTWERMKRILKKQFLQETYEEESYLKFHAFKQGALSVDDYTREFEYLRLKSDTREKPSRLIARYLSGLNQSISNVIRLQPHWTFGDVVKLAKTVEEQQKEDKKASSLIPNNANYSSSSSKTSLQTKLEEKSNKTVDVSKKRCFKCQGFGHLQADCPNRRMLTVIEYESDDGDAENKSEEIEVYAVEGEPL